mgnify:CR=1 FL=1
MSPLQGSQNVERTLSPASGNALSDLIGSRTAESGDRVRDASGKIENKKQGSVLEDLPTGDVLIKDGKSQHLLMPNGDRLTVNADGSYALKSKDIVKVKSEGGITRLSYANGDSVEFDKHGIRSVQRGKESVAFARPNEGHGTQNPPAGAEPNVIRPGRERIGEGSSPNVIPSGEPNLMRPDRERIREGSSPNVIPSGEPNLMRPNRERIREGSSPNAIPGTEGTAPSQRPETLPRRQSEGSSLSPLSPSDITLNQMNQLRNALQGLKKR